MTYKKFTFKTKRAPQAPGTDGAGWETLPLSNLPPGFDISFPDSTANSLSQAMSNITTSFKGVRNTLESATTNLQSTACQLDSVLDSLQEAFIFADEFANQNNNTNIYARVVGLDPVGNINSQTAFEKEVRQILSDTGDSVGKIPKIVPAQIPIDPILIANALINSAAMKQIQINAGVLGTPNVMMTTLIK